MRRRALAFAAAASLAALGFAALQSPTTALGIRWLIGRVVYSTSNAAVLLALATASVASLLIALEPEPRTRKPRGFPFRSTRLSVPALLVGALVLGHLAHGLALALWAHSMGEASTSSQYVWSDGVQSFTSLTHSHLGKSGLAALAERSGWTSGLGAYDVGEPLARFVPAPLAWMLGLTTIASFVLLVAGLPEMRRIARGEPRRWIAYLVGGLSCAQLVADGGPLSLRFGPSMVLLLLSLPGQAPAGEGRADSSAAVGSWAEVCARRLPFGLVAIGLHLALWCLSCGQDASAGMIAAAPQWALYGWILGPRALRMDGIGRIVLRRSLAGASFGVVALGLTRDAAHDVLPLLRPLTREDRVVCVDLASLEIDSDCVAPLGRTPLEVYAERGDPLKPADVFIERASGKSDLPDPGKPFLLIFEPEVDSQMGFHGGGLFRIAGAHASRLALPSWIVEIARVEELGPTRLPAIGGEAADIVERQNRHVWMRVLDAALQRSGVDDYVLLPLSRPAMDGGAPDGLARRDATGSARFRPPHLPDRRGLRLGNPPDSSDVVPGTRIPLADDGPDPGRRDASEITRHHDPVAQRSRDGRGVRREDRSCSVFGAARARLGESISCESRCSSCSSCRCS